MNFELTPEFAAQLDAQDELAAFREKFVVADPDLLYLDGNSLGRLPQATRGRLQEVIEQQWGQRLIRGWNEGWLEAPHNIGDKIAQLIGAQPGEVLLGDSTSANLFKLAVAALKARPGRPKIVSDALNFPSDLYIFQGIAEMLGQGHTLKLIPSRDGIHIQPADVAEALDEQTALLSLTHVAFKSAFMYDLQAITAQAHAAGALTLWDLSHSAGAVPLHLSAWGVDLAVGCTYKYLNGGPGAPAFLYVRRELQNQLMQPIWGWFAAKNPFAFELDFAPAEGLERFRGGTPPMLSLLAIDPAVDILLEAGIERLRAKSVQQSEYLLSLARAWLLPLGFRLGSPEDSRQRGSHISLRHPEAYRINRAMLARSVIPDFRAPDNLRLGIAPIYTTYGEIYRALEIIRQITAEKIYLQYSNERLPVT
ncbi:MAG TPA: kynureninase [Chloroflexi bacterium]|nr:kynureninase [Chloroflexota bacterium]